MLLQALPGSRLDTHLLQTWLLQHLHDLSSQQAAITASEARQQQAAQAAAALHPCMTGIACQDVQDEHPDDSSFCFDDDDDGIPATDPLVQPHMQSLTAAPTEAPATAKPALCPEQAVLPAPSNIEIKVTALPQQHTTATSNASKQAGPPSDSNMPDATQISDDDNPDTSLGADSHPHIIIRYGRPTGPAWILSIKDVLQ